MVTWATQCPICIRSVRIRSDGNMYVHRYDGKQCDGSGCKPGSRAQVLAQARELDEKADRARAALDARETDPESRPCSGCGKTIEPGDSNWCPSGCSCLGARWCTVCLNRHLDARQALGAGPLGGGPSYIEDTSDLPEDLREALGPPGLADATEAERYQGARRNLEARGLITFLQWLCRPTTVPTPTPIEVQLAARWGLDFIWEPVDTYELDGIAEHLFAAFYGIDLRAVDRHRRRVLAQLEGAA